MQKHKEKLNANRVKIIAFISFFIGFSQAVSMYVLSTFFEKIVGENMVGFFYAPTSDELFNFCPGIAQ